MAIRDSFVSDRSSTHLLLAGALGNGRFLLALLLLPVFAETGDEGLIFPWRHST